MALVPCPDCGNEISSEAWACPKCGRPTLKGTTSRRRAAIVTVVIIVAFAGLSALTGFLRR